MKNIHLLLFILFLGKRPKRALVFFGEAPQTRSIIYFLEFLGKRPKRAASFIF
jgi:hypothetical protein